MAVEHTSTPGGAQSGESRQISVSELLDRLGRYDGPPDQFLVNLLAVQCRLASAAGGAILRPGRESRPEVLAVYPPVAEGETAPVWLAQAAEAAPEAMRRGQRIVRPVQASGELYGQPAERNLVLVPLHGEQGVRGVGAYLVESGDQRVVARGAERLELTIGLLSLYEMRLTLQRRQGDLRRLRSAMEVLSAVNEHDKFAGAAMALCNEVVSRWDGERASLGVLRGRYVKLQAMSHTEKFSRKMQIVQDLEAAMEECLDQDLEIVHPAAPEATYVQRAAAELARRGGSGCVLSVPLRHEGEVFGVLTIERAANQAFSAEEVESLRLTADLVAGRLVDLDAHGRWIGARAARSLRKGAGAVVGPKHTWAKLAGIAAVVVILALVFVKGEYRATAPFQLEADTVRTVEAPFEGYLRAVEVEAGQRVAEGERLGAFQTAELRDQLADANSRHAEAVVERRIAMAEGNIAKRQIAESKMEEAAAEMRSLSRKIAESELRAPIAGLVLQAVKPREVGSVVKTGDPLFQVSPVRRFYAELSIPEDQISDVEPNQTGQLVTEAFPDQRIDFVVERIDPVAVVEDNQNVFKVRARLTGLDLEGRHAWMRVGMKGAAKVVLGEKPLGELWTRRLVNWVKMKLWTM